jgi:cobalt/nickel transport protein
MRPLPGLLLLVLGWIQPIQAHFPILIHDADLTATNGPVTVTYATGHPFELELEPAARPERVRWLDRRGRATDVTASLAKTSYRADTNAIAWQFVFDPAMDDLLVALDSETSSDPRQKTLYREYVKLWLYRGRQESWQQRTGQPLEIVPLTRPYGLLPGTVFTGRLMRGDQPVADTEIYAERLSDQRPDPGSLPPEPLITFVVRTDGEGRFALTLIDPGWWVFGAYVDDLGSVSHQGETWRLEGFAGAWVRVEERRRLGGGDWTFWMGKSSPRQRSP